MMTNAQTTHKPRILVITEDDPLYVINFFDVFFSEWPKHEMELVGVCVQHAFHESKLKTAKRIWNFFGPIDFFPLLFRYGMAKLSGRSIGKLAGKHGFNELDIESVNSADFIQKAQQMNLDVIVSVAAPEIFKKEILSVPKLGCINIHSGRLPQYRGMMPNFWQLLNGESHACVTVHEMVPKLDAGAIVDTLEFPLKPKDSLHRVITETKREGARLMIRTLRKLVSGTSTRTELDMAKAKYYKFPAPADVKQFRARGHTML
jgi:methionyl-tRNA formyltransferase